MSITDAAASAMVAEAFGGTSPHLMSRVRQARPGRTSEALAWALEALAFVHARSHLRGTVGTAMFGRPAGTIVSGAIVGSCAEWIRETDQLAADPEFVALSARGAELFVDAGVELALRIVALAGPPPAGPPAFYQHWTMQFAAGHVEEGLDWGADAARYLAGRTGLGVLFGTYSYGPYGTIGLNLGAPDLPTFDAAATTIAADRTWRTMLADIAPMLVEGTSTCSLGRNVS